MTMTLLRRGSNIEFLLSYSAIQISICQCFSLRRMRQIGETFFILYYIQLDNLSYGSASPVIRAYSHDD